MRHSYSNWQERRLQTDGMWVRILRGAPITKTLSKYSPVVRIFGMDEEKVRGLPRAPQTSALCSVRAAGCGAGLLIRDRKIKPGSTPGRGAKCIPYTHLLTA